MKAIRDMKLAVTMIALGHEVLDFAVEGKTVYLKFDAAEIEDDEAKFYIRGLAPVSAENMLSALQRFRLLLIRIVDNDYYVSSREAAISLMAHGFMPIGLQQLEKMLYFKFEGRGEVKQFLLDLVNGKGMFIAVDEFWIQYQHFSDALRSR